MPASLSNWNEAKGGESVDAGTWKSAASAGHEQQTCSGQCLQSQCCRLGIPCCWLAAGRRWMTLVASGVLEVGIPWEPLCHPEPGLLLVPELYSFFTGAGVSGLGFQWCAGAPPSTEVSRSCRCLPSQKICF